MNETERTWMFTTGEIELIWKSMMESDPPLISVQFRDGTRQNLYANEVYAILTKHNCPVPAEIYQEYLRQRF